MVDPSFLELVRLAVKRAGDPAIRSTLPVVDQHLAVDTPGGRFWHRFDFDGYGETRDGGPWRITDPGANLTLGRAWPIFAGERGEYELAAGQDAQRFLDTMASSANAGLLLPEQVWDGRPPTGQGPRFALGEGTFSATPLAWSPRAVRAPGPLDRRRPPGGAALRGRLPLRQVVRAGVGPGHRSRPMTTASHSSPLRRR